MLPRLSGGLYPFRSILQRISGCLRYFRGSSGDGLLLLVFLFFCVFMGLFFVPDSRMSRDAADAAARKKIRLSRDFCIAAAEGNLKKVQFLLAHERISPNFPRSGLFHETPLILAVKNRHWTLVHYLLRKNASPNLGRCNGMSLLEYAFHHASEDLFALLLRYRANPNVRDGNGDPLLFAAVRGGKHAMLKLLLEAKADLRRRDRRNRSVLHEAVNCNDGQSARLLLQYGAEINALDCLQETPLHLAARKRNMDMMFLLLKHGADPGMRNISGQTAQELFRTDSFRIRSMPEF